MLTKHCLVLYVFHAINENVLYFLKNGIFKDDRYTFLVIINSRTVNIALPDYVEVLQRDNVGHDFGGWSEAVFANSQKYDNYVFINSSVIGPFLPTGCTQPWPELFIEKLSPEIKLVGTTINTSDYTTSDPRKGSHVQSMTFAVDRNTLAFLITNGIFSRTIPVNKTMLVQKHEVGMSRAIIAAGYNITGMMKFYDGIDFRNFPMNFNYIRNNGNINWGNAYIKHYVSSPTEILFVKSHSNNAWIFNWLTKTNKVY